ncbi:unnamed protein product [Rotaria sp. Silwood1]|nr:unnamed protein product [Rotaria sp. Silwood1]CAF1615452.1 unnamed protein product [Rotaria sp. Silwood1]CAF4914336.1 unnamed protein product [Rotaria sp. Silwood1]
MALAGVDEAAIDFVQKLPERVKDAEALLSGDLDRILERGALTGLPVGAVQQIVKNGFTVESVTQLAMDGMKIAGVDQKTINLVQQLPERIKDAQALMSDNITQLVADGMTFQGADQKTIDFVKQIPERIKDAETLLSGDMNRILERGALASLPVEAVQQIVKNGFTVESVTQLAMDGMKIADVDQKTINLVQQLPERIKDAQALMSGDLDRILDRGMLAGLPVKAIQNIRRDGFSASTITRLVADGMVLQGVDKKTIDLVKQIPERIKDAEALLSGDLERILERGVVAGLPIKTIQQIVKNGFTVENTAQLTTEGMTIAGVDQKTINVVQQLLERIKDAQALMSGDLDQILKRGMLAGLSGQVVQDIRRNGFSANTITRLVADGMTLQGVDNKTIDLVKQLPERIQDAEALLSGDINRILEIGKLAGLPLNAMQQIAKQGFSEQTVAKLAADGMSIAGVDQNTIDFVRKLPERVRDLQAIGNGDPSVMLEYAESMGLPVDAIRLIANKGFSTDMVTQLALESMTMTGVDSNKINFVKKLPEQIKDAQALLSGDKDQICKRGMLGDLPINATRQVFEHGVSPETVSQFIASGMSLPDVNQSMIGLVRQLPERMKDAQALLSGDINTMLERGMSAGLPLNTVQQIVKQGFSPETVTQLALEGMTLAGVDQKQVEFVKRIPGKIQGAQALIDGDLNELLKRNTFGGVSIDTLRELASQNNSVEIVKQIALTGMAIADIDENSLNFVKKIPENIKNMERYLNGDLDQLFNKNMSGSINQLLRMFNENSLFSDKEKEIFQLVRRQMPVVENMFNGDGKAVLSNALNTLNRQDNSLRVGELLEVGLPSALQRVADREQEAIHNLYKSALDQLKSINGGFNEQKIQVIQQIPQSSDKWNTFERKKHQLDDNICRILCPMVEREKRFREACESLATGDLTLQHCCQALKMKFEDTQKRASDLKSAVERSCRDGNFLLKQAMGELADEISCPKNQTKSPEMVMLLKEHFKQTVIGPFAEQMGEREMDLKDTALVDQFTNALTYLQNQQGRTR